MAVPFFSLQRQWNNTKDTLMPAIEQLLDSQQYIGGKNVKNFEDAFSKYVGASYAVSCNSGTDALWLALKALGLKPDSLVLTTPFSFIASTSEIVAHRAHPIYIDIDETSYNISPHKIKSWLEKNATMRNNEAVHKQTGQPIAGIVAVNIFGQCANYTAIKEIALEWNLWIVEDAAQSVGASHVGGQSGTFGDITTFSFYPTKNLGACGDAGMATTDDEHLANKLIQLRNHGRTSHYEYQQYGVNSRMDGIQATILTHKLALIDSLNDRRRQIANLYHEQLEDVPFVVLPETDDGNTHTYHQFALRVVDDNGTCYRDDLAQHLQENEIGTRVFYPETLSSIPFLQTDLRLKTTSPVADDLVKTVLCLPIWPELTDAQVMEVCEAIKSMPLSIPANKELASAVV